MIPKIIHYCWFGKKNKPESVLQYIESWKRYLPDYKIKEWNEDNFPINYCKYTEEAYRVKKFAFVSDVCRLYALLTEGGIYLDTDVEVISSFNQFIYNKSFIGMEIFNFLGTAVIGSEGGANWIKNILDTYKNEYFILRKGKLNTTPNVQRITKYINENCPLQDKPIVYPIDFFCAKDWKLNKLLVTENTICIHHYDGSWNKKESHSVFSKLNHKLKTIFYYLKYYFRSELQNNNNSI